jgi:hypothetical protein
MKFMLFIRCWCSISAPYTMNSFFSIFSNSVRSIDCLQAIINHSLQSKSRFTSQGYQVSESPELTRVLRQFIDANRAPWQVEKDF